MDTLISDKGDKLDQKNKVHSRISNLIEKLPILSRIDKRYGKHLPNILTLLRILSVPVFVLLLIDPSPQMGIWAMILFITASFTDWLDGYIARLYEAESILGTLLDPLADKVLVMAALVMLAAFPFEPRVPAWMVVVLLSREFMVTGLRALAAVKGVVIPASELAKHKTAWTFIAIICLLLKEPYEVFGAVIDFHTSGMAFLWIALFLSMTSGIQYGIRLHKVFS
ncbi:MAG TPA: CDP-diacylglycerol--glycerol-3-phosphate 3-phosphatidyltransferase [Oligoflexia bacterium]|nr:CDP-diacylglycerol--glycerol-3-phosphate 3-phosphatidyltransferase [Oligoflexia bacterium]HMP48677.1 CDP-diacylglycerol--glycerol-3-phosphate 3-phosphatidyltransferase [Oligoflexia bacterium]